MEPGEIGADGTQWAHRIAAELRAMNAEHVVLRDEYAALLKANPEVPAEVLSTPIDGVEFHCDGTPLSREEREHNRRRRELVRLHQPFLPGAQGPDSLGELCRTVNDWSRRLSDLQRRLQGFFYREQLRQRLHPESTPLLVPFFTRAGPEFVPSFLRQILVGPQVVAAFDQQIRELDLLLKTIEEVPADRITQPSKKPQWPDNGAELLRRKQDELHDSNEEAARACGCKNVETYRKWKNEKAGRKPSRTRLPGALKYLGLKS
jgi:hypothetical protein